MSLRRGYLLAEAIAALALAGVLAAAAALALGGARKAMLDGEQRDRAQRAERESLAVILHAVSAGSVVELRGDTALDLDVTVLLAVVCAVEPTALVLPPLGPVGASALTHAAQPVDTDDVVSVLLPGAQGWWVTTVDSVTAFQPVGSCDLSEGWTSVADDGLPRIRLVVRDTVPSNIEPGMTVRVGRPGRFTLYHAGGGEWMLGWRRCSAISGVCGVVQPVSGPLRPPAAGGLRFTELASPPGLEILVSGAGGGPSASATVYW